MNDAAHVIQLALTPIFLLTAVGSLLNVFVTRLGRISDRVHALKKEPEYRARAMQRLKLRSRILDLAVISTALAGGMTCCAATTLFFDGLRQGGYDIPLLLFFGGGLIFAVAGLFCFVLEIVLAGHSLRDDDRPA